MATPFEIETQDHVATLWLANPERRNAMGPEFWAELPATIAKLDADEAVRAIVVAAKGPHFSTGLDLIRMSGELGPALLQGGLAPERLALLKKIHQMRSGFDAIVACNKPFVAAVHGYCIGGGLDLIASCDVRVASATARFSLRETKIAIVADMGSLQRLEAIVARGHLRELAFTGKDIDAERALRIGLVNDVFATDEATLVAARELAREIADNTSPVAVALMRQMMWRGLGWGDPMDAHRIDSRGILSRGQSADVAEGVTSFLDKRPAVFPDKVSSDMPDFFPWWDERIYS